MKIGILGSGIVGQTLALGFENLNDTVMIGSRNQEKLSAWKKDSGFKGKTGSFNEAVHFGDMLVLAVPGAVADQVVASLDQDSLNCKIIIDATNPISSEAPEKGVIKFFTSLDKSLMEQLQTKFPAARFVKAFNCIGSSFMVNPDFNGIKPTMFICGNDAAAKNAVKAVLVKFGFDVEDMGAAEAARAIEPLCILWCIPGLSRNEWSHAFKLLKR